MASTGQITVSPALWLVTKPELCQITVYYACSSCRRLTHTHTHINTKPENNHLCILTEMIGWFQKSCGLANATQLVPSLRNNKDVFQSLFLSQSGSAETGPRHLSEKRLSQWSFKIQSYLKSTSCAHTQSHSLCVPPLLHFASTHPLWLAECELFWWMDLGVEQRSVGWASSGGQLTALSEILQTQPNSGNTWEMDLTFGMW